MTEEEENQAQSCKVVLIGESGVGKTSIINRYTQNTFSSVLMSTQGAGFTSKTIFLEEENKSLKFEIWDTAGQEIYRALAKVFYKNAAICVLVYDVTRRSSIEELRKYWMPEIKANASPSIILAVAANKSDMLEYEEVKDEEGRKFAKEINAIYQKTSAKESTGVDQLFKNIGKKFLNPDSEITSNLTKDEIKQRGQQLRREEIKKSKNSEKKGCC